LLLAAVNVAGLAVVGYELGGRIAARFGENWTTWARVGLGAAVPVAVIVLLWLVGWCFTFFAWLGALILGSFGLGAIIVRMLGISERAQPAATAQTSAPAAAPVATQPGETPATADAAEVDAVRTTESVSVAPQEPGETVATEPESIVAVAADAPAPAPAAEEVADFTQITGIGPKLSQKLVDAGVRTYADLGARTAGEVAQILGWTEDRVARVQIVEQAQRLATTR
jgi:predicted flap endonuclease-1-like 5' DNA nuclease